MTTVTLNGHVYSADGSAALDMLNGGHRANFIPCLADMLVEVGNAATSASNASASASAASTYAAALSGTSATSTTIGTGSKSFTASTGKQWQVGQYVYVARSAAPTTYMAGQVTAYNSGTGALTVDVTATNGSGTYTDWVITIGGAKGTTGSINSIATSTKTTTYTAVSGDLGTHLRCTGTWTLGLTAAATLGAGWWCRVVNDGTGTITIDPNASETIRGATTLALYPNESVLITCDGSNFAAVFESVSGGLASIPILSTAAASMVAMSAGEMLFDTQIDSGQTNPGGSYATNVFYAGSLYVVLIPGVSTTSAFTSSDGVTWTARTMPSSGAWQHVVHNGTNFAAVKSGAAGTAGAYSSNGGVTWTANTMPSGNWSDLAWGSGAGLFVAVKGDSANVNYATSPDGITWTQRTSLPSSSVWNMVAHNGTGFLVANSGGTNAAYSTDGLSWTSKTLPFAPGSTLFSLDGKFYVYRSLNGAGNDLYESSDGTTWTLKATLPGYPKVTTVGHADGAVVKINGTYLVAAQTSTYSQQMFVFTAPTISGPWTPRDLSLPPLLGCLATDGSTQVLGVVAQGNTNMWLTKAGVSRAGLFRR